MNMVCLKRHNRHVEINLSPKILNDHKSLKEFSEKLIDILDEFITSNQEWGTWSTEEWKNAITDSIKEMELKEFEEQTISDKVH